MMTVTNDEATPVSFLEFFETSNFSDAAVADSFYGASERVEENRSGSNGDSATPQRPQRQVGVRVVRGKYYPRKATIANAALLEGKGFGKDELIRLYATEKLPVTEITKIITEIDAFPTSKSTVHVLLAFWGIPFRTGDEACEIKKANKKKNYIKKYSLDSYPRNEIVSFYHDLGTFQKVAEETNLPYGFVRKVLSSEGYNKENYGKNKSYSIGLIMDKFDEIGLEKSDFEKKYSSSTRAETTKWLADVLGMEITYNDFTKILRHLAVRKVVSHKRPKRNNSEANRLYDLERLKKAGFGTVQELADYFESCPKLKYGPLLVELNSHLSKDDFNFTPFWLERNMIPLLPFDPNRHPASPRDALPENYCRPDGV